MDVLLVVFDTVDLPQLVPILLTQFELIEGLTEHAFLGNFKRLAGVGSVL